MKGKTKLLSFLAAMTLTCGVAAATQINPNFDFGNLVFAEQSQEAGSLVVAGTSYESFEEALTAVSTMAGDVTVEVYGRVTWNKALTGSYDSIAFVGANDSAEIYLDVQGYLTATGKNVSFKDLKLSKVAGGSIYNAGFMNVAFGVYDVASVTYTNCTFLNGAYASTQNVTFKGCTFYRSHDKYGLWAYGNTTVTVDGCTFADIRGIKMFAEGGAKTVELTVTNTDFSAADNKPSIVLTYGKSVTLANNTYSPKGVFELDLDGAPNGTAVTSTDPITCVNDNGACGVIVDGKIYTTLAQAVAAAEAGDTVTVLASGDEIVDVDKNLTITGTATLNNVGINANGADELTVSGLSFTGNSWINSGTAEKLTVSGVKANVTPVNGSYTNSRSAFISLGRSEQHSLNLTVENCQIVANGGTNPILGWAAITGATIKGNTFGSADAYQWNSDSVKFMSIADGAVFNVTGNTVYSNYNGFVFGQNTTRDNAYTVNVSGNTFMGGADHIWVEVSGSNTTNATINMSSDNTLNGQAATAKEIIKSNVPSWTSYAGMDLVFNANGKIIGGNVVFASNDIIADGYALQADGRIGIENAQARIGNVDYATLKEAFMAVKANDTITLMNDVTHEGKWDCRNYTGTQYMNATFSVPVTIDGNGHTLKIKGAVSDGNINAVFKFSADATVKNLTLDLTEATSVWRGITAVANITVDNCTFKGNNSTAKYGVIYGEGAGANIGNVTATITNSTFEGWSKGVSDNANGQDAKSVTVTGNTFNGSNVWLSAYEKITFNDNIANGAVLNVTSNTNKAGAKVQVKDNTFDSACTVTIKTSDSNIDANIQAYAKMGEYYYWTNESFAQAIKVSTDPMDMNYKLKGNVNLFGGTFVIPAGATFNGNGKVLNGTLAATGDLTFAGECKVSAFVAGYYNRTFTIGKGASLEILSDANRTTFGWGNTFNIVGSIGEGQAKTADKASIKPSLIAYGASFAGTGCTFNVTNAYIKSIYGNNSYWSSTKTASGTFTFNVTNSIWEQYGKFHLDDRATSASVDFNMKDSVFTTTSHLVFGLKGNVVFDNTNVNVDNAKQLENCSTMTIKNGSVVHAIDVTSDNGNKPGTMIVDGATYIGGTDVYTGALDGSNSIGTLIIKNSATVSLNNIAQTIVYYEDNSTFTYNMVIGDKVSIYKLNTYNFTVTPSTDALKANESMTVEVAIDKAYYSLEYTFTYDAANFTCAADSDHDGVIFVQLQKKVGEAGVLATYTLTAKNEINSVSNFDFAVSGKAVQYKEQTLNNIDNDVFGETESVKVSLNYTASVVADYVSGYSLVLVKGDDAGYAYNGNKMFYVEAYKAYAYLVKGEVTVEMIDAVLSKATGCEKIYQSYDVNAEYVAGGEIDIKDATAVYACSIVDFTVEDYVELYLRADVNGDGKVNVVDINEVVKNYKK